MQMRIRQTAALSLLALAAVISTFCVATAAASVVSPLPASDYTVRPVCAAPAPGYAGCLALRLVPRTAAAHARVALPPAVSHSVKTGLGKVSECPEAYPSSCLVPQDLRAAYFPSSQPDAPASEPQTIALVDAYNDPKAEADLNLYSQELGLPALSKCVAGNASDCFQKVNQNGEEGNLPFPSTPAAGEAEEAVCAEGTGTTKEEACHLVEEAEGWALETSTDIEIAHAICQNCRILLVETNSGEYPSLETAEDTAVALGASEISDSWGGSEPASDSNSFNHPGTVITAAAGDNGYRNWTDAKQTETYFQGADYPASSPNVIAVGGTRLTLSGGARQSETVWNDGEAEGAAGGGCSEQFIAQPWQQEVPDWNAVGCGVKRAVADVSADADPASGVAVYDSVPYPEEAAGEKVTNVLEWVPIGGTSVASPIVASIFALAGGAHGVAYPAETLYASLGSTSLHDVTKGGNGKCDNVYSSGCSGSMSSLPPLSPFDCGEGASICNAALGYDGPTGVGTPNGIVAFSGEAVKHKAEEKQREEQRRREEREREERPKEGERSVGSGGNGSTSGTRPSGSPAGTSRSAGTGQPSEAGGSEGRSSIAAGNVSIKLSAFALTPNALLALNRARPKVSALAFAFTLSAAADVRVTLAKRVRVRGHGRWKLVPGSLTFAAAKGPNHRRLINRDTLTPGRYRLTLTPRHGSAGSIVFQIR
jgi:hypothetical protein